MSQCQKCGQQILWNDRLRAYVDAKPYGDDVIPIVKNGGQYILHNTTCPVLLKQRITDKCAWCQLERGRSITSIRNLFDFMTCDKHADETIEIQYHGKTYKRNKEALRAMYWDATKTRRRKERKAKRPEGTSTIEVFLTKGVDGEA